VMMIRLSARRRELKAVCVILVLSTVIALSGT